MHNDQIQIPFLSDGEVDENKMEAQAATLRRQRSAQVRAPEADVARLIDMGFSRDQVMEALAVCEGVVDQAAQFLLNSK